MTNKFMFFFVISGPPFAFVEFEDGRDASDAVKARDGYDYDGYRLRVEFPRGGEGLWNEKIDK